MPIQRPSDGRNAGGTSDKVSEATGANSPAFPTSAIAGEFSVRKTSADDDAPSCTSWFESCASLPLRRMTLIRVSRVNASAHSWARLSCCAL